MKLKLGTLKKSKIFWLIIFVPIIGFFSLPYLIYYYFFKNNSFEIDLNELANPHTIITGSSGYGKTTLCKELISQVDKPTLILDVHNEYSDVVNKVINPLETTINLWDDPKETISILQRTLNLGSVQVYYLEQIIKNLSTNNKKISNKVILEELRKRIEEEKGQKKATFVGIYRRLSKLEDVFAGKKEIDFKQLINSKTSIDLSKIKDESIQLVYSELLLRKVYFALTNQKKN